LTHSGHFTHKVVTRQLEDDMVMGKYRGNHGNYRGDGKNFTVIPWDGKYDAVIPL